MAKIENKPAEAYAKNGTSVKDAEDSLVFKGNAMDSLKISNGVISKGVNEKGVKTDGIKIRGTGAATKGVMARGPMA